MASLVGENVSELASHLPEGVTITRPELAQAVVTREGLRHGDVAHVTILGVDLHQAIDVPVFLQLPERLHEPISHLSGHKTTSHAASISQRGYCLPRQEGDRKSVV